MASIKMQGVRLAVIALSLFSIGSLLTTSVQAAEKHAFNVAGVFVETCSCAPPCACELTGLEMGCEGVGAFMVTSGKYMGVDLAGAKVAFALEPAKRVRLYVDAKNPGQRQAASAFAKAVYSGVGKIEAVKNAKIAISGKGGRYTVTVDGGKIMKYTTEPVLGGDNRTPVGHTNIHDVLNPTVMQGKNVSCTYHDGNRSFTLEKGTNAYFNDRMKSSGKI